jgi:hypothetical protein
MSDNRAARAYVAASRGYRHDNLSTDDALASETADALMRNVGGKAAEFSGPQAHRPITRQRRAAIDRYMRGAR